MTESLKESIIKALDTPDVNVEIYKHYNDIGITIGDETVYDSSVWDIPCLLSGGYKTTIGNAKLKNLVPYAILMPNTTNMYMTLYNIGGDERLYTYEEAIAQQKGGWQLLTDSIIESFTLRDWDRYANACVLFNPHFWENLHSSWLFRQEDEDNPDEFATYFSTSDGDIMRRNRDAPLECLLMKKID